MSDHLRGLQFHAARRAPDLCGRGHSTRGRGQLLCNPMDFQYRIAETPAGPGGANQSQLTFKICRNPGRSEAYMRQVVARVF